MADFDFDLLTELEKEAPSAGFSNVNYGKLTTKVSRKYFEGSKKENNLQIIVEPYDGKPLNKERGDRLQFTFTVGIQEFNSSLTFDYERSVDMVHSRGKFKTDWDEIVFPSLKAVFGDQWAKAIGKKPYVLVEDAPQVNPSKDGKEYSTIKFLKVFKNKAEAEADRAARFGSNGSSNGSSEEIPASVIAEVKAMAGAFPSLEALKEAMSENNLYPSYDHNKLIELASK